MCVYRQSSLLSCTRLSQYLALSVCAQTGRIRSWTQWPVDRTAFHMQGHHSLFIHSPFIHLRPTLTALFSFMLVPRHANDWINLSYCSVCRCTTTLQAVLLVIAVGGQTGLLILVTVLLPHTLELVGVFCWGDVDTQDNYILLQCHLWILVFMINDLLIVTFDVLPLNYFPGLMYHVIWSNWMWNWIPMLCCRPVSDYIQNILIRTVMVHNIVLLRFH